MRFCSGARGADAAGARGAGGSAESPGGAAGRGRSLPARAGHPARRRRRDHGGAGHRSQLTGTTGAGANVHLSSAQYIYIIITIYT